MKKTVAAFLLLLFSGNAVHGWGFHGHRLINRYAVFCLPESLFGFYKTHIDWLADHATDADKRRYAVAEEACRHYLDCDRYERAAPLDTLPMWWHAAVAAYSEDTLQAHGIVPWHCYLMLQRLTEAFREKDAVRILRLSADLGHYIADAHVPLHACGNYNGQRTGQHGIHGLWESRIPELYSTSYDKIIGTSPYLNRPMEAIWDVIGESYAASDSVLQLERGLNDAFPADRKYSWENRGNGLVRVYSQAYCAAYDSLLQGMVVRRFRQSMGMVAAFWYTAWVNAGQPELPPAHAAPGPTAADKWMEQGFMNGLILGRPEEH